MSEKKLSGIAQFIPIYPDQTNKNLAYELSKKKEFNDLKLGNAVETAVPYLHADRIEGNPFMHQKLNTRFISPHTDYKSVLVFYDPGLGKTSVGCHIVEQFKNIPVDGKLRKPAIILVPNDGIRNVWINEIVNVCTQNTYVPEFKDEEQFTERKDKGRRKKVIQQTFMIQTYDTFTIPKSEDLIRQEYSNRIIIIDEAHNIKEQSYRSDKEKVKTEKKDKREQRKYDNYYNFLHTVENCRIVLLTATPVWDQTHEIASLMNLIIPREDKLPTGKRFMDKFFTIDNKLKSGKELDKLKSIFRGRVSYLRLKLPIVVTEMGVSKPWLDYIKVYPDIMSSIQSEIARKARENVVIRDVAINKNGVSIKYKFNWNTDKYDRDKDNNLIPDKNGRVFLVGREIKGGALAVTARQACILVAPVIDKKGRATGVTFDEKYFSKYFVEKKEKYSFKNSDGVLKELFVKNLYTYSAKYASIIQTLKDNPTENVFIYNRFVEEIGGILPFAMILALHGFQWITTTGHMKTPNKNVRRFMVFSTKTEISTDNTTKLIARFNHKDNIHGDLCQIIIGSQKIAVGLTLKNIRQIHFISPWWNIPSLVQVFGRGYRLGSHDDLPKNERYINLYRHVAVYEGSKKDGVKVKESFPHGKYASNDNTIDTYMYGVSQTKETNNSDIYRFMKKMSWDCPLSYNRNVLATDEDFSRQCDYRKCEYDCDGVPIFDFKNKISKIQDKNLVAVSMESGIETKDKDYDELRKDLARAWKYRIPPGDIERDTYNLYYSSNEVAKLGIEVINQFRLHFTLSLDSLMRFIPVYKQEKESLLQALAHIIDMRIPIRDRYGFDNYLQEYNNIYFLNTNTSASYSDANYTSNPLVTEKISLEDVVKGIHFKEDKALVEKFCKNPSKNEKLLDKIRCYTFIILLETMYHLKRANEKGKKLTTRESNALIVMDTRMKKLLKLVGDEGSDKGDAVHVLYQSDIETPTCDISNKALKANGTMRIYDESLNKWKFLEDRDKEERYINKIKEKKKETALDVWDGNQYGLFGLMKQTGDVKKFAIREKLIKNKNGVDTDVSTGRGCHTRSLPLLASYFFKINYFPEVDNKDNIKTCLTRIRNSKRVDAIKALGVDLSDKALKKMTAEKIRSIAWLMGRSNKEYCSLLKEWFETHDDENGNSLLKE